MNGNEFIDIRDQLDAYLQRGEFKYLTITLLSGDKYIVTNSEDVLICPRVVFVFQSPSSESCFLFETICNIDVIRKRET